jgi:AbrB family looped-hinge helix DNA binding protein
MALITKVTTNGQVTLPKLIRDQQQIKVGDVIEVVNIEDGVLLRPYVNNRSDYAGGAESKRSYEKSGKKKGKSHQKKFQNRPKKNRVKDEFDPTKYYGA